MPKLQSSSCPTPTSTPILSLSLILTLGALDASCLCCACAGVCAAVAARPTSAEQGSTCRRALAINIWFGDFVEAHSTPVLGGRAAASTTRPRHLLGVHAQACYPYMARDGYVRAAALCGARAAEEPWQGPPTLLGTFGEPPSQARPSEARSSSPRRRGRAAHRLLGARPEPARTPLTGHLPLCRSSAYLPIPIATAVCDAPLPFAAACASAFLVPFVGTLLRRMPPLAAWGLLSGLSDAKDAAGPSRRRMSPSRSSSSHSELPFSAAADQRHQH